MTTEAIHGPSMSPHLPLTPDQIGADALGTAEAGAAILHLHARDPTDGSMVGLFREDETIELTGPATSCASARSRARFSARTGSGRTCSRSSNSIGTAE
ncbi:MAG: 3-keto-5-aminohexanoate cleavage protein [Boseongicola sp. SB0677_bin_26]|nr:3-keto-5-aminohexanoate cleavage protein [Boseongicola sp. SB0665_bin_10]MYG27263.1 3-keto-5-aminohexanoate cleavage protein [Boseongicola sp. SB0677_bin_26]